MDTVSAKQTPIDLLIQDVYVINNKAETSSKTVNIQINDGKILALSQAAPAAKRIIQGKGRYVIPGLIDSHVHLLDVPGYKPDNEGNKQILAQAHAQIPKSYLYFGFTTLLDLANAPEFVGKWNEQEIAPQVYHCSPTTIPNAYPLSWLPTEKQFTSPMAANILYDPRQADIFPKSFKPEQHSPEALAKRIKDSGASCIKTYYETGFGTRKNLPVPTEEMIKRLVKSAHKYQLPVFLHGNSAKAHRFAVKTGVDILAHGLWHAHDNPIASLVDEVIAADIRLQPTMQVIYGEMELFNPDFLKQDDVTHAIPEALIQWYKSDAGQWMKHILEKQLGLTDTSKKSEKTTKPYELAHAKYETAFQNLNHSTKRFADKGGKLVFASDTPSGPFYTQFPGVNGHHEILRLHSAGISLKKIFLALTHENARLLRREKSIGSVEPGLEADLLLVDSNPLKNIDAYKQIQWVILNGKAIPRGNLSARK